MSFHLSIFIFFFFASNFLTILLVILNNINNYKDGKTRVLRDRIKSVKNTRRITEAMRLVAAARVRRAQDAVLKTRPLIAQLQLVSWK